MYKLLMLTLVSILFSIFASAQELKVYKTFGGLRFERDTTELTMNHVAALMKENTSAYEEITKARKYSRAAAITGFTGAVLLAFPLGTAAAGGEPEWIMAAGGAALLIASMPLTFSYRKHTLRAVDIYNNKSSRIKPEVSWMGTQIKLRIHF